MKLIKLFFGVLMLWFIVGCNSTQKLETQKYDPVKSTGSDKAFYGKYSQKMGIKLSGNENKDLIVAIDSWLGVPHKMGGCSKSGIDCSCFVKSIYSKVYQVDLNRTSRDMYARDVKYVSKSNLKEGDLVFFKINGSSISHVGIYIKDNKFVHASSSRGVIISSLDEEYYRKRFYSGGRVKGVS